MVKFGRGVEPGIIKIHDLRVELNNIEDIKMLHDKRSDDYQGSQNFKSVRMLGMRDDEFLMDKSVIQEDHITCEVEDDFEW